MNWSKSAPSSHGLWPSACQHSWVLCCLPQIGYFEFCVRAGVLFVIQGCGQQKLAKNWGDSLAVRFCATTLMHSELCARRRAVRHPGLRAAEAGQELGRRPGDRPGRHRGHVPVRPQPLLRGAAAEALPVAGAAACRIYLTCARGHPVHCSMRMTMTCMFPCSTKLTLSNSLEACRQGACPCVKPLVFTQEQM